MNIDIFDGFFKGKKVLVTGHTGFKGSWLCIWLHELGAEVVGVGLDPFSERDNFVLSGVGSKIKKDIRADIRDGEKMKKIFMGVLIGATTVSFIILCCLLYNFVVILNLL